MALGKRQLKINGVCTSFEKLNSSSLLQWSLWISSIDTVCLVLYVFDPFRHCLGSEGRGDDQKVITYMHGN